MKQIFFNIIIIFPIMVNSCTNSHSVVYSVDDVLKMNPELTRVLEHYSDDSLKYEAAQFLIRNLPYHYSMEGDSVLNDYKKLYELHGMGTMYPEEVLDSIRKICDPFRFHELKAKNDIYIDPDYLIDNIDWAFKVWQEQPWGKNIPFGMFCEYILPYRVADEVLEPWREIVYNKFNPLLDSIRNSPDSTNLQKVSKALLGALQGMPYYFTGLFDGGPFYGPKSVDWRSGSCQDLTYMTIYVFRALGVPCGEEFMINRGNGNAGHYWNAVFDNNGHTWECSIMYPDAELREPTKMWDPKGKVYRQTFSINAELLEWLGVPQENLHPQFRTLCMKDVTIEYSGKSNCNLRIKRERLYKEILNGTVLYLCLASRMNWVPIGIGKSENGEAVFADVEGEVVFRVATYENGNLIMQSDPFLLDRDTRTIRFMPSGGNSALVKLLHKYNLIFEPFVANMEGGVFEASNSPDFFIKDTLHVIDTIPDRLMNEVWTINKNKYRYVRFYGADNSNCNIAEMSFYQKNDTVRLAGRVIGTRGSNSIKNDHDIEKAIDGNPYTSFDYKEMSGGWVGLDFGKSVCIDRIIFTPRNRDNFVRNGDVYELYYSDRGEWKSAGIQKATSDSLLYTIPKGSLLYLRDLTRGKDERIFEMVNGKQKYW